MEYQKLKHIAFSGVNTDHDLNVCSIGLEQTSPDKSIGPCVRNKYIIHYVLEGHGFFNGERISRGSGFLICPDKFHSYSSDKNSPLKYGWISFFGNKADMMLKRAGLTLENHIFECEWIDRLDDIFESLSTPCKNSDVGEYLRGCFHILLSFHIKAQNDKNKMPAQCDIRKEHIDAAIGFIKDNFVRKLTVSEVASQLHLSPKYLSNLFHDELKISPKQYILDTRMKRACELLAINSLSVTDIANSVGYSDPLNFSKLFKKFYGVSPRKYRDLF